MDWDLIQNIVIVLLVLWNLTIVSDAGSNDRILARRIRKIERRG